MQDCAMRLGDGRVSGICLCGFHGYAPSRGFVVFSVRKRPVRPGFGSAWAGLGFCWSRPGRTVGRSPASEACLTGPGRTADICRLSSDKL